MPVPAVRDREFTRWEQCRHLATFLSRILLQSQRDLDTFFLLSQCSDLNQVARDNSSKPTRCLRLPKLPAHGISRQPAERSKRCPEDATSCRAREAVVSYVPTPLTRFCSG